MTFSMMLLAMIIILRITRANDSFDEDETKSDVPRKRHFYSSDISVKFLNKTALIDEIESRATQRELCERIRKFICTAGTHLSIVPRYSRVYSRPFPLRSRAC